MENCGQAHCVRLFISVECGVAALLICISIFRIATKSFKKQSEDNMNCPRFTFIFCVFLVFPFL